MKINLKSVLGVVGVCVTAVACAGVLQGHPDIRSAYEAAGSAISSLNRAQNIHNYHMGGHAQRAIELLQQAQSEMLAAAESTN